MAFLSNQRTRTRFQLSETGHEVPSTRLTIGNVPMSFSNEEILKCIELVPGVKTPSRLMEERARDEHGKRSHWKTGRRSIYIDVLCTPLNPQPQNRHIHCLPVPTAYKAVTTSACVRRL